MGKSSLKTAGMDLTRVACRSGQSCLRRWLCWLALSMAFSLQGCGGGSSDSASSPPAVPVIGMNPATPRPGDSVAFTATGNPAGLNFSWDFGDGSKGAGASVTHRYVGEGNFTVSVIATNSGGLSATATSTLSVLAAAPAAPTLALSDAAPYPGESIKLTAASTDPQNSTLTFEWDFGDGQIRTGEMQTRSYANEGSYPLTITVVNALGKTARQTFSIPVSARAPVVSTPSLPSSAIPNQSISFTAEATDIQGSPIAYAWDFGDGQTANGASVSHAYASQGVFRATLAVSNAFNKSTSVSTSVQVIAQPPAIAFITAGRLTPKPLEAVTFTSSVSDPQGSALTYSWDFGDGATAGTPAASHGWTTEGAFTARLNVTNAFGRSSAATIVVTVTALAPTVPTITIQPAQAKQGDPIAFTAASTDPQGSPLSYQWTFGDGGTAAGSNVSRSYAANGTYAVQVRATNSYGKSSTGASSVAIVPPPVVTLSAAPVAVAYGSRSQLTWSSTNATSCQASGGWSGSRGISGNELTPPIEQGTVFTLTCTGPAGTGATSAQVMLTGPVGQLLSGSAGQPALTAITEYVGEQAIADSATFPDEGGRAIARTRLLVRLADGATVDRVNAQLARHQARILAMLPAVRWMTLNLDDPGSLAALRSIAVELTASGQFDAATETGFAGAASLPSEVGSSPNQISNLIAAGFPAAWNARKALDRPSVTGMRPTLVVGDYFGKPFPSGTFGVQVIRSNDFVETTKVNRHGYEVLGVAAASHVYSDTFVGAYPGEGLPLRVADFVNDDSDGMILFRTLQAVAQQLAQGENVVLNTSLQCVRVEVLNGFAPCSQGELTFAKAWEEAVDSMGLGHRFIHVVAAGNRYRGDALTYNWLARAATRLGNGLIVESRDVTTLGTTAVADACRSDFSNVGGNIAAPGRLIRLYDHSTGQPVFKIGTSYAAAQVAGLASYLWALAPHKSPHEIIQDIQTTARLTACSEDLPNSPAPVIDAYAAVLRADSSVSTTAAAPVRTAILDIAGSSGFGIDDVGVFLAQYVFSRDAVDYLKYDLNGDGITGGTSKKRFDLNADGRYTSISMGDGVTLDENLLTDRQILCYYVQSQLALPAERNDMKARVAAAFGVGSSDPEPACGSQFERIIIADLGNFAPTTSILAAPAKTFTMSVPKFDSTRGTLVGIATEWTVSAEGVANCVAQPTLYGYNSCGVFIRHLGFGVHSPTLTDSELEPFSCNRLSDGSGIDCGLYSSFGVSSFVAGNSVLTGRYFLWSGGSAGLPQDKAFFVSPRRQYLYAPLLWHQYSTAPDQPGDIQLNGTLTFDIMATLMNNNGSAEPTSCASTCANTLNSFAGVGKVTLKLKYLYVP